MFYGFRGTLPPLAFTLRDWGHGVQTLTVATSSRVEMIDITDKVVDAIRKEKVDEGIAVVFVPHTTAGVTINENADPDVVRDIVTQANKIVPFDDQYHHTEGNSAAHIKSCLVGPSLTLIISGGRPVLGTWQAIYFCEFDGPRRRKVHVTAK
jgi:secondary thiamine-phosphate synthase enzyme